MADLMDEIGEDLREQQLKAFWKENGAWIIGGIILAIVATGALSFWRTYQHGKDVEATASLIAAARGADASKIAEFSKTTDKDHAAIAKFLAAGAYLQQGKASEAAGLYAEIEATSGIDRMYRDLAALYAVRLNLETGDAADLHKKLDKLTDRDNTWYFTALETRALLFAREGKNREAAETFSKISGDAAAPQEAKTRAFTMRELYLGDASAKEGK